MRLTFAFALLCFTISATAQINPQINALRLAVEKNPESVKAHEDYTLFFNRMNKLQREKLTEVLEQQYDLWMKKYPKSHLIPLYIGKFYYKEESPAAKRYLLKAVEIKPDLAEAYELLYIDAMRWGDADLQRSYIKKAADSDRKNANYALDYAYSIKEVDKARSDSLLLDVDLRFPKSESGATALYFLAINEPAYNIKMAYLKHLLERYDGLEHRRYKDGMGYYFMLMINEGSYEKAFELALHMISGVKENKLAWKYRLKVARGFIDFNDLYKANKLKDAYQVLNTINLRDPLSASGIGADEKLFRLKAEVADLLGDTKAVYDTVIVKYSRSPSYELQAMMYKYGQKIGRDSAAIFNEILALRQKRMVEATPFSLTSAEDGKTIASQDLRGKIILLTYWFPGCGPCRGEFPHFESVLKKFSKNDVVYLAINGYAEQEGYVLPFLKSTGYSFTPLKDDPEWDKGNLPAGYPSNYLIDQNGKLVHSNFHINKLNEDTLELMIKEMLVKQ